MPTVRDIYLKVRALIDDYTEEGVLIPEQELIDLQQKCIPITDMAQKELYKIGKLYKTFEFTNKPAPNLLGLMSNFDIVDFTGELQLYPNSFVTGAKAYYFEAEGTGECRIETTAGVLVTTIEFDTATLTSFRGLIPQIYWETPLRLIFDGTEHYRHANRCLYNYPFNASKIPDYKAWVKVTMPADFRNVDQIITEYPPRQYAVASNYKWEGYKDLYINYYYDGTVRVVYKPIPVTITDIDQELEVDDITIQAIVYYVAARIAPFENKELVQFFETKYMEMKIENTNDRPTSEEMLIDVYRAGGYSG